MEEFHSLRPERGLRISLLFTLQSSLDRVAEEGSPRVPLLSGWVIAWMADPAPGLMHVLQGVHLPQRFTIDLEERLKSLAGLREAA
jgi:hypothetical protein